MTQKRKNTRAIMGTMTWLGFDVISIVQSLFWGKDMVLKWFGQNAPTKPEDHAKYTRVVADLALTWNALIVHRLRVRRPDDLVHLLLLDQQGEE